MAAMIRSERAAGDEPRPANDISKEIEAVYKAGMEINYLPSMPSSARSTTSRSNER